LKIVPLGQRKEDCLLPSSHTWKTYKKIVFKKIKHEKSVVGTGLLPLQQSLYLLYWK
jgi:hypothetical protein